MVPVKRKNNTLFVLRTFEIMCPQASYSKLQIFEEATNTIGLKLAFVYNGPSDFIMDFHWVSFRAALNIGNPVYTHITPQNTLQTAVHIFAIRDS